MAIYCFSNFTLFSLWQSKFEAKETENFNDLTI